MVITIFWLAVSVNVFSFFQAEPRVEALGLKVGIASATTYYLGLGIKSVWIAISQSICVEGLGLYFWFRRGSWKKKVI